MAKIRAYKLAEELGMERAEFVEKARAMGPLEPLLLHPLAGGMDPELSWESLRLMESRVLPALREGAPST